MVVADVEREVTLYSAPLDTVGKPDTPWTKICGVADKVTSFTMKGDDIYLMTYAASPRFSVVRTSLAKPDLKSAATVVAPSDAGDLRDRRRPRRASTTSRATAP